MKQFALWAVALFGVAQLGSAAPVCVSGTLASYIALGGGGCMIGTNILSNFSDSSFLTGATAIPASSLTVTPIGGTTNPGITVNGNVTANAGQIFDALINYTIGGNTYTGDSITVANTNMTGNGAVSDVQNACQGGTFAAPTFVTGCPGTAITQTVIGNGTSTAPVSAYLLGITHEFTVDSGGNGTASGGTVTDQFTAISGTPEPGTYVLTGLGLALAMGRKLRKRSKV